MAQGAPWAFENPIRIVYYAGVDYVARMFGSQFFQGILGDEQLGDTTVSPTVPILDKLP
jgi:hypothetical protein